MPEVMDNVISLAKRRGFIFASSEIYGGINGFWDYGPVGVELKRNIKEFWWKSMVASRNDMVGVDTSIICHPQTWVASGHVASFSDPMTDCRECKKRFRTDDVTGKKCPACGGELTEARQFNLMFQTNVGAAVDAASVAYLRPETCQSIFTNFKTIQITSRQKIPFGIAQIGKSFRNEITPRNFIFRSREFEQMEMEFFIKPDVAEGETWYKYWIERRQQWFFDIGIRKDKMRLRPHAADELAHYALGCTDVEYQFPFGWSELEGIANRGNFDLSQHAKFSGKDLSYFDEAAKEKFVPAVIESSVGVDRTLLTVLVDAFVEEEAPTGEGGTEVRTVLKLHPRLSPYKAAVFPLVKKLSEPALKLTKSMQAHFPTDFDDGSSIGKRYRRHDEIGTPFGITYDHQSAEDQKVTIRERDSMRQERVGIDQVINYVRDRLA